MPSRALIAWQAHRLPALALIDAQCAATFGSQPANPVLADENLRAYVMLLSGHFQAFCRDLYTEGVQLIAARLPAPLTFTIQLQFEHRRELEKGNPSYENLQADFNRFGSDLTTALTGHALGKTLNEPRITDLGLLNRWRNYAAHRNASPPRAGGPLTLAVVKGWQVSCAGLASELDEVMYNRLQALLGNPPW